MNNHAGQGATNGRRKDICGFASVATSHFHRSTEGGHELSLLHLPLTPSPHHSCRPHLSHQLFLITSPASLPLPHFTQTTLSKSFDSSFRPDPIKARVHCPSLQSPCLRSETESPFTLLLPVLSPCLTWTDDHRHQPCPTTLQQRPPPLSHTLCLINALKQRSITPPRPDQDSSNHVFPAATSNIHLSMEATPKWRWSRVTQSWRQPSKFYVYPLLKKHSPL